MTVYIVIGYSEWYGGYHIIEICATEKLAKEIILKVKEEETYDGNEIWWEEHQVKEEK